VPDILVQLFGLATIASAIRAFVPLYLATLGGVFNERSGIVNIGIDGMMIFGTWFGAWGALRWGPEAGLLLAIASGVAAAALHAMATITFRVDHIVSGVAINILAIGLPRFLTIVAYGQGTQSPRSTSSPSSASRGWAPSRWSCR
jgi:simple sugar transport system permease protein